MRQKNTSINSKERGPFGKENRSGVQNSSGVVRLVVGSCTARDSVYGCRKSELWLSTKSYSLHVEVRGRHMGVCAHFYPVTFRNETLVARHGSKCHYPLNHHITRPALYILLWRFLYWNVIKLPKSCFDCL